MATAQVNSLAPSIPQPAQHRTRAPDPCIVVIFGASGDLTKRKLLPALYHLDQAGLLPENFAVVGVARRSLEQSFAPDMKEGIVAGGGVEENDPKLAPFVDRIQYHAMNFDDAGGYDALKNKLAEHRREVQHQRQPPLLPRRRARVLLRHRQVPRRARHGQARRRPKSWVRTIIEKPFGHDLESARALNDEVNKVFSEDQIFRIDHYLGKETVQNILVFRFANGIFENVWNRNYIDHVEITAAESIGIEGRGPFYETAGALRDVVQNHVMELLSFVAMEPPVSFEASAVRSEKVKVWQAIQPIHPADTVRGQYGPGTVDGKQVIGYRQEDRVHPRSQTETYAALRAGDRKLALGRRSLLHPRRQAPRQARHRGHHHSSSSRRCSSSRAPTARGAEGIKPNVISMRIQPDEGIALRFGAKVPGPNMNISSVNMNFSYADAFGKSSANGYERLLLDAMLGDGTLFAHRDGVEATWALMTPILEAWAEQSRQGLPQLRRRHLGPRRRRRHAQVRRPQMAQTLKPRLPCPGASAVICRPRSWLRAKS